MKILRKEKNGIRYHSFDEVAQNLYGLKPYQNVVHNPEKKKSFIEKFESNHMCKKCKKPMTYLGGNIMACTNPNCGSREYILLDDKSKSFANFIYTEGGEA